MISVALKEANYLEGPLDGATLNLSMVQLECREETVTKHQYYQ